MTVDKARAGSCEARRADATHRASVVVSNRLAGPLSEAGLAGQLGAAANFVRGDTDVTSLAAALDVPPLGHVPFDGPLAGTGPSPASGPGSWRRPPAARSSPRSPWVQAGLILGER